MTTMKPIRHKLEPLGWKAKAWSAYFYGGKVTLRDTKVSETTLMPTYCNFASLSATVSLIAELL